MASQTTEKRTQTWLRRLLAGDHEAFADFVNEYKSQVFLCCRTLGLKEDEADDVASETFLAAYQHITRYRGRAELGTWLWKIAYCKGVNYLRKNNRREGLLREQDAIATKQQAHGPAVAMRRAEHERLVWEAVERLPRLWALAVILCYRQEKSIREIAKIMQTNQNTVKTYLFRARKRLQELLANILGEDINARE